MMLYWPQLTYMSPKPRDPGFRDKHTLNFLLIQARAEVDD
jgi:hypothetical protein